LQLNIKKTPRMCLGISKLLCGVFWNKVNRLIFLV
jgi:hypothetical protein